MSNKAVIIYSGGMDSFTLLNVLLAKGYEVEALSFNYGQRHSKELEFADAVCSMNNVPHRIVNMADVMNPLLQGSSLTSDIDVPEGHYAEDNMKATVVPNRNAIMLMIATGYAVSIGFDRVYTGVHAGDHDVYPDCRAEFIEAMNAVTQIANYTPVSIEAPFLDMDKGDILKHGAQVADLTDLDYEYAWTCYNGREEACGKCGACVERLEAFHKMGWHDPLAYEDREFYIKTLGLDDVA